MASMAFKRPHVSGRFQLTRNWLAIETTTELEVEPVDMDPPVVASGYD